MRLLVSAAVSCFVATAACGAGTAKNTASQVAPARPTLEGKCEPKAEARPLVVEKDSAERARLESLARSGVVAVRYVGCELEVLPQCKVGVGYRWSDVATKRERVTMRNVDELYTSLPFGAVRFEGALSAHGELNVDMTIAGRYEAQRNAIREDELAGDCEGATHVVTGFTAGAFRFYSGSGASVGANGGAFGASAGAKSTTANDLLNEDGDAAKCGAASNGGPPAECSAVLRLELSALKPGVLCQPTAKWDGKACVSSPKCTKGTSPLWGACVPNNAHYTLSAACLAGQREVCSGECDRGDAESCEETALNTAKTNPARAIELHKASCEKGLMRACLNLGVMYALGTGSLPMDPATANTLFQRACDGGFALGCNNLARHLASGTGITKDLRAAEKYADVGCAGGDMFSCDTRADIASMSGDWTTARTHWEKACSGGHPGACFQIGDALMFGRGGVAADRAGSATWFRKGCDGGNPAACAGLAQLYLSGDGLPKDAARAVSYAKRACNGGAKTGCYTLARAYVGGEGVPKDTTAGVQLFRKTCDEGHEPSCAALGRLAAKQPPSSAPAAKAAHPSTKAH